MHQKLMHSNFIPRFLHFGGDLQNNVCVATLESNRGKASLCFKPLLSGSGTERHRETTKVHFQNVSPYRITIQMFMFGMNSLMYPNTGSTLVSIASGLPAQYMCKALERYAVRTPGNAPSILIHALAVYLKAIYTENTTISSFQIHPNSSFINHLIIKLYKDTDSVV